MKGIFSNPPSCSKFFSAPGCSSTCEPVVTLAEQLVSGKTKKLSFANDCIPHLSFVTVGRHGNHGWRQSSVWIWAQWGEHVTCQPPLHSSSAGCHLCDILMSSILFSCIIHVEVPDSPYPPFSCRIGYAWPLHVPGKSHPWLGSLQVAESIQLLDLQNWICRMRRKEKWKPPSGQGETRLLNEGRLHFTSPLNLELSDCIVLMHKVLIT